MAIAFSIVSNSEDRWGKARVIAVQIDLSGVYPVTGYAVDITQFGFKGGIAGVFIPASSAAVGYSPQANPATGKLQLLVSGAAGTKLAEVAAGTDVTNVTFVALIIGY